MNQQFLEALKKENEETLFGFIAKGVVGNQPVDDVESVLDVLIERGFHKAAKALLENGTSADPIPPAIFSIINHAIEKQDLVMVDLLLKHGAYASPLHLKSIDELRKAVAGNNANVATVEDLNTGGRLSLTQFNMDTARTTPTSPKQDQEASQSEARNRPKDT